MVFAMLMEASKFSTHLLLKKSNFSTGGCKKKLCKPNNHKFFVLIKKIIVTVKKVKIMLLYLDSPNNGNSKLYDNLTNAY